MNINKEREAFEDWYCKNHTGLKQSDLAKFRTLSGYSFSDSLKINISWEAWQAAIARMEVRINTLDEILLNQGEALAQAKAQAVQEWISVKDSLPNRQVNVLVASKHNFVCIASLTNNHKNNKFYDGDSLAINSITHWMPLPKPPKSTGASQ